MTANSVLPRSRRWLSWLIGGVTLLLIACVALGGYGLWRFSQIDLLSTTANDTLTQAQIEQLIEARLPPSATNVHSYYTKFQDYFACVSFEIDPADLHTFVATTPFTQPLSVTTPPAPSTGPCNSAWWHPHTATHLEGTSRPVGSGTETLMIDMSDPQRYIVYWTGFST